MAEAAALKSANAESLSAQEFAIESGAKSLYVTVTDLLERMYKAKRRSCMALRTEIHECFSQEVFCRHA